MTAFKSRSSDNIHWMQHKLRTEFSYQTEQGNAFSISDRWSVPAGATEYLEFRIPVGTTVRVYNRFTAVAANKFNFDLCAVTSITPGSTEMAYTNMKVGSPDPVSRIWRGATSPVGLSVKEYSFLPSATTGNASGALVEQEAYRVLTGSPVPSILRVNNTGASSEIFNIIVLFTENADE